MPKRVCVPRSDYEKIFKRIIGLCSKLLRKMNRVKTKVKIIFMLLMKMFRSLNARQTIARRTEILNNEGINVSKYLSLKDEI